MFFEFFVLALVLGLLCITSLLLCQLVESNVAFQLQVMQYIWCHGDSHFVKQLFVEVQ